MKTNVDRAQKYLFLRRHLGSLHLLVYPVQHVVADTSHPLLPTGQSRNRQAQTSTLDQLEVPIQVDGGRGEMT